MKNFLMKKRFRPLYGRDHPKTHQVLQKNAESNPSVTDEDRAKWHEMEKNRIAHDGPRCWGPGWQRPEWLQVPDWWKDSE